MKELAVGIDVPAPSFVVPEFEVPDGRGALHVRR
jgi:hypothetical protein